SRRRAPCSSTGPKRASPIPRSTSASGCPASPMKAGRGRTKSFRPRHRWLPGCQASSPLALACPTFLTPLSCAGSSANSFPPPCHGPRGRWGSRRPEAPSAAGLLRPCRPQRHALGFGVAVLPLRFPAAAAFAPRSHGSLDLVGGVGLCAIDLHPAAGLWVELLGVAAREHDKRRGRLFPEVVGRRRVLVAEPTRGDEVGDQHSVD